MVYFTPLMLELLLGAGFRAGGGQGREPSPAGAWVGEQSERQGRQSLGREPGAVERSVQMFSHKDGKSRTSV